jgi:hypothetical protein
VRLRPAALLLQAGHERTPQRVGAPSTCPAPGRRGHPAAVSYTGRCSFGAGGYSFRGAMAFDDAKGRFFSQSTVQGEQVNTTGKKSGNTVTFSSSTDTQYGKATSSFSLAGSAIKLSFKLVDKKGRATTSAISFAKQ